MKVQEVDLDVQVALLGTDAPGTVSTPWAGNLVALGRALARYCQDDQHQTIVAITVPARDYAAVLIATGWVLNSETSWQPDWEDHLDGIQRGMPVRMIVQGSVVTDRFYGWRTAARGARVHVGATFWELDKVISIEVAEGTQESEFGRTKIPGPGGLVAAHMNVTRWIRTFGAGTASVAMVGAKSRLYSELDLRATREGDGQILDRLGDILRPRSGRRPCWGSVIISGAADDPPEPPGEARLAILDGQAALRWLPEISTPLVVAIIDRSGADESAIASVLQLRSTGLPVTPESAGWRPQPGIESLSFQVLS